jgi:hypothetical protein
VAVVTSAVQGVGDALVGSVGLPVDAVRVDLDLSLVTQSR